MDINSITKVTLRIIAVGIAAARAMIEFMTIGAQHGSYSTAAGAALESFGYGLLLLGIMIASDADHG